MLERAVRVACQTADIHLTCSYPNCGCGKFPPAIRAVIRSLYKPTQAMKDAGDEAWREEKSSLYIYRVMLDAALGEPE